MFRKRRLPKPIVCPHCKSEDIEALDLDTDEMSEAEASDYEASLWGVAHCRACGQEFDWGF